MRERHLPVLARQLTPSAMGGTLRRGFHGSCLWSFLTNITRKDEDKTVHSFLLYTSAFNRDTRS
jgi:hypothetical protein